MMWTRESDNIATSRRLRRMYLCLGALFLIAGAAQAALNLSVEASPDPVQPGERMRVVLTVANPGASTSGAVTLVMEYPAGLFSLSDSLVSDGGDCINTSCDVGEQVTWNLGALPPGKGITVSLPPVVRSGAGAPSDGTSIPFAAEVFEGGVSRALASDAALVRTERVLDLTVDEEREPAAPGTVLTYELTYGNRSSTTAFNTELRFPVPAGTSFVSASGAGVPSAGDVVWNLGNLIGHEGGRQEVTVLLGGGLAPGTLLEVDAASLSGDADFSTHTTRARAVTRVKATTLGLSLVAGPDPAEPGEMLAVELTVTNRSTFESLSGVVLRLHYPVGLFSLSDSLISDGGDCPNTSCDVGEMVIWSLGTLPPGRGITVNLPPVVSSSTAGGVVIPFAAEVSANGGARTLVDRTVLARSERVLGLAVDEDREPVAAGEELTYVLTYGNRSSTTTSSTEMRLPLPAGTSFVAASGGGFLSGGEVVWSLGSLVGHEGGRREVTVLVDGGLDDGALLDVNAATLTGESNFLLHQAHTRAMTRVEGATRFDVSVTVNPDPPRPGETLRVELTVTNTSAVDFLFGTVLRLSYPAGLFSVGDSLLTDGGDCPNTSCDVSETVTWNLGTLPPGGGTTVVLPATVSSPPGGDLIPFAAEVSEDAGSSALARHTVLVRSDRVLDLTLDTDREPAAPGGQLTYVLTYGNRSATSTTSTELRLPLPAGATPLSASGAGQWIDGAMVWNLGTLGAHEGGRREVTVELGGALAAGTLLEVDAASLRGEANFLLHETRARAVTRVEAVPLSLSVAVDPEPARPGDVLQTELTVTNTSAAFLFNVVLQLRYPEEGLNSISETSVSDGGFCPNTSCDPGELVTWNLGTLPPAGAMTVSLPPVVKSGSPPPDGTVVRFWAHAVSDSFGKAVATKGLLVNDTLDEAPVVPIDTGIFSDGFESGNTSVWSSKVP